jgi:hypothetical protein
MDTVVAGCVGAAQRRRVQLASVRIASPAGGGAQPVTQRSFAFLLGTSPGVPAKPTPRRRSAKLTIYNES